MMKPPAIRLCTLIGLLLLPLHSGPPLLAQDSDVESDPAPDGAAIDNQEESEGSAVHCANLVYADGKTSVCFSDDFLKVAGQETNIRTHTTFDQVHLDSAELFNYPFAVMTGEGSFTLTEEQVLNMQDYLLSGGFLVASSGCSSEPWNTSFRKLIAEAFPDTPLKKLEVEHPIFHSVYDITQSRYKTGGPKLPHLEALEIDGRVVMVWSPDGLNDTANAAPECCCCGGNEVKSARKLNVNILAYALTH